MSPDFDKLLSSVEQGRRDFLRKIIAGAAFAPPLIASFSLDGLSLTAADAGLVSNQTCFVGNQTVFLGNQTGTTTRFDFSGTQYQDNFRDILRGTEINAGLDLAGGGHPALNFTGTAGAGGGTWMTVLDSTPSIHDEDPVYALCLSLSADILIHRFNNGKGAGLLAGFNEQTGKKGLALLILNGGNTDVLQLSTVDQAGKLTVLKSVDLRAGILENVWYRLIMDVAVSGATLSVTGMVFKHVTNDPNAGLDGQVGAALSFSGAVPAGVDADGEVGLIARAVNAVVDTSVTNFAVSGVVEAPC